MCYFLGNFWKHLDYFLFKHLVTLSLAQGSGLVNRFGCKIGSAQKSINFHFEKGANRTILTQNFYRTTVQLKCTVIKCPHLICHLPLSFAQVHIYLDLQYAIGYFQLTLYLNLYVCHVLWDLCTQLNIWTAPRQVIKLWLKRKCFLKGNLGCFIRLESIYFILNITFKFTKVKGLFILPNKTVGKDLLCHIIIILMTSSFFTESIIDENAQFLVHCLRIGSFIDEQHRG